MPHNNELEARKQELQQAFATVLEILEIAGEMGSPPPDGVYSYLWKTKFKLEGLSFVKESEAVCEK